MKTLVFDPRKRMTIDEAIKHPVFDSVRNEEDFQLNTDIDLELSLPSEMSMEEIKVRMSQEIKYYTCELDIE